MKQIKIGNRVVGKGHPCFIIAEAGANFRISDNPETNFKQAIKLINIAADSKADAVKFQLYKAERLYIKTAGSADYLGNKKSIYDIIKEMELPYEWLPKLKNYCDKKKIIFLCTPFDEESADELDKNGISAYKIASYSINNLPLLKHIAKKNKPIILSTGASSIKDIDKAIETIKDAGNSDIVLMQCTAKYPAPLSTLNLNVIPSLIKRYNILVGLSDHSREPYIPPLGAVALGAKIIEKHFTTDNSLPGPDHSFAILGNELKEMVSKIRLLEEALGSEKKTIIDEEKELYEFARSYIYAADDIKENEEFTIKNLIILRCGKNEKGMDPEKFDMIIGKKSVKKIKKHDPITPDLLK